MGRGFLAIGLFWTVVVLGSPAFGVAGQSDDPNDAAAISASGGRANRDHAILVLRTKGKEVRLEDGRCLATVENRACRYRFLRYENSHHAFVVEASSDQEFDRMLFIGEEDGHITVLPDEPHFSPDGRRFVVARSCEAFGGFCGLQVWSAVGPKMLWEHRPTEYAVYEFTQWQDGQRVALTLTTWVDHHLVTEPAALFEDHSGRWNLVGPVERSR